MNKKRCGIYGIYDEFVSYCTKKKRVYLTFKEAYGILGVYPEAYPRGTTFDETISRIESCGLVSVVDSAIKDLRMIIPRKEK